jgi:hypothetical protein
MKSTTYRAQNPRIASNVSLFSFVLFKAFKVNYLELISSELEVCCV